MSKQKTLQEEYDLCVSKGCYLDIGQVNLEKVRSLLSNAETSINSANILIRSIDKKALEWMTVFICYYDALRMCTEALITLDKKDVSNHQCLFAYLCTKHPELEFNWGFLQKVRTKRNGANYYGSKIVYGDWKEVDVQFNLYTSTLKKEIEKRLKE